MPIPVVLTLVSKSSSSFTVRTAFDVAIDDYAIYVSGLNEVTVNYVKFPALQVASADTGGGFTTQAFTYASIAAAFRTGMPDFMRRPVI